MVLTARTKAAVATAVGLLLVGFAVILRSATLHNPAGSIGGACLVMTGLALAILIFVRRWICDTRDERRALAEAQRQAQAEQTRFIALEAAQTNEMGRLAQERKAERARNAAILKAERDKLRAEFEGNRNKELSEAFKTGVEMERSGALRKRQPPARGNLLTFPKKQPAAPEAERSREHGVVGP